MTDALSLHTWTLDTTPLADPLAVIKKTGWDAVELRRLDFERADQAGQSAGGGRSGARLRPPRGLRGRGARLGVGHRRGAGAPAARVRRAGRARGVARLRAPS